MGVFFCGLGGLILCFVIWRLDARVRALENERKTLGQPDGFWREAAARHLKDYEEELAETKRLQAMTASSWEELGMLQERVVVLEGKADRS